MTDQSFKILQTHEQDLTSLLEPCIRGLKSNQEAERGIGGSSPAADIETVSFDQLRGEGGLAEALLANISDYCYLLFHITEGGEEVTDPATLSAWLGVPAEIKLDELPGGEFRPLLTLVPPSWKNPPKCEGGSGEDPSIYIKPNNPAKFFEKLEEGIFADHVPEEQLNVVKSILGNCKPDVDCPGVLGCWT